MYPFRIFISYSTEDREHAATLAAALQEMRLTVVWDPLLPVGQRYSAELRGMIRRSHLFVALLSKSSARRAWVHQEIGYAIGAGVPVIPISVDDTRPEGLIGEFQAIRLRADELGEIGRHLPPAELERRVRGHSDFQPENFVMLETPEERSERITEYAREAMHLGGGRIRQRGAFSSFCLPRSRPIADNPHDPWKVRDGSRPRAAHMYQKLYEERRVLEEMAAAHGCTLVIRPTLEMEEIAVCTRLRELRAFLLDERVRDVRVVAHTPEAAPPRNVLIVGDWFYAESRSAALAGGYDHTFCTWHAPSVLRKLEEFDDEFDSLVAAYQLDASSLRASAIRAVDEIIGRRCGRAAAAPGD